MALWSDIAEWVGPTDNHSGPMQEYRGLVLHIMQGTYEGSISWAKNPASGVSFHFATAGDGRLGQLLDTGVTAWTQASGNGHWISVENEGFSGNPLTGGQVEACAQLYARGVRDYGWPLQATNDPNGRGLGWHGMGGDAWGGHFDCPGEPIKAQRPAILARALQIINGSDGGPSMGMQVLVRFTDAPKEAGGPDQVWLCDGMWRRKVAPGMASGQNVPDGKIGNNGTHSEVMLGNLGNGGQVFAVDKGGWADADAWGVDLLAALGSGGGGGGGVTPAEVSALVRAELDKTRLTA